MKVAVIVFPGISCEKDVYKAIKQQIGEKAEFVQHDSENLENYDVIFLPGGASYGDAVRPGAIAKLAPVMKAVKKAAEQGKMVVGIGNGFQILLEAGLLPGAIFQNENLKFTCRPVELNVENNQTAFSGEYEVDETINIPVAHKFGSYYCAEEQLKRLQDNRQIVFTYKTEETTTAASRVAGIINEKGNVLGLMPHPERAVEAMLGSTDGIKFFQSIANNWRESYATNA